MKMNKKKRNIKMEVNHLKSSINLRLEIRIMERWIRRKKRENILL